MNFSRAHGSAEPEQRQGPGRERAGRAGFQAPAAAGLASGLGKAACGKRDQRGWA